MSHVLDLCSALVDEQAAAFPELATVLGIPGGDDRFSDYSLEGAEAHHELLVGQRSRLRDTEPGPGPWEDLARSVAIQALDDEIAWFETDEHRRDLNSLTSPVQDLRDIFDHMDLESADGWSNAAARLHALPTAMAQYRQRLESGRRDGLGVARRQVVEAARQARNHAGSSSFFLDFVERYDGEDAALRSRLAQGAAAARRAYGEMAEYLEQEYLPSAPARDAVGPDRYVVLASRFLGTHLDDPLATYDWGWSEVHRLRGRMAELTEQISPGASLPEVLHLLKTDPDRAAHSQEEFVDLMKERQEIALRELEGVHFDVPEAIRSVDVRMTPPGGPLGAYYVPPSEDHARPGTIWWSKGDMQFIPLFDEISTAYHEGFPGHHLQNGIQVAGCAHLSRFQKLLVWYPGTGEGWALYAEDLMEELGYLEKPDYVMGKLATEMLRAARVVIDIGSHLELAIPADQSFHPGAPWTFERGVELLEHWAAQGHPSAVSEMNRYLGWPGQAISYKIGQQAIRDLRDEERSRLGSRFDEKAFHARILEIGSTGLDVLRDHVRTGLA
jgi:uncharacterized protein (DUF885 family)